jgi:HlyD family secretion protein
VIVRANVQRWPLVYLAGACGIAAVFSVLLAGAAESESETPAFRFASVARGNIEQTVTVTGTLKPVETVEVGSQLSGQLSKLYVDFNDTVRVGQPLAQIDPRTFQAKVDEVRAELAMAIANITLEEAKLDRTNIELKNARDNKAILAAKLESAQALKNAAAKTLERKLALEARQVIAAATLEDAQTDLVSKTAQQREAEILVTLNAYSVEGSQADVRRTQAELEQARAAVPLKEASLRAAQADLDRTVIRSPIDGVIVGRFVNEGQTLAVGLESRTTFSVAHRLEDMEIHARVDETDIGRIVPGQQAHFTVDAYPDQRFEAVVRQVRKAPQVDQNVVTYTVVLSAPNRDGALLPGMTALVKLVINRQENVLTIPLAALRFRPADMAHETPVSPGSQGIWVRNGGASVRRIPITLGSVGADQVGVNGGEIAEGDQVVVGQAIRPARSEWFGIKFGS